MLRKIRTISAILFSGLITFFFLDFTGVMSLEFHWLTHIQIIPALISISLPVLLVWIALTLILGRIYCSVICPLGIFQDVMNRLSAKFGRKNLNKKWNKRRKRFNYSPARNVLRWTVLAVTVLSFVCGFTLILGLLDPYSAFGRMVTNVFKPLYMLGNNLLESVFTGFGNYTFYRVDASITSLSAFIIGLVTFLLIGYLAWKHGRAWCNTVCPVGTLLGFLSKYSLLKIRIEADRCTHCLACGTHCKASCIDSKNGKIDYSRCIDCFDCIGSCKEGALSYSVRKKEKAPAPPKSSPNSRRQFLLTGLTTTLAAGKLMGQAPQTVSSNNSHTPYKRQHPITPPGSVSLAHFQASCTSCHLCVSKCPSHVLKPAFLEYGLGGLMQPTVYFDKGFCNYDCTVCTDICPNDALRPLTVEQKHRTQVGRVVFIEANCIVHIDGTNCGACSEHCPTQALSMVPYKDGLTIPHVDTSICVGCGGCEYVCPARPFKAVYIEGNEVHQEAEAFQEEERQEVEISGFGF